MPRLVAVGTAVPPFTIDQQCVRESAGEHFRQNLQDAEKLLSVFDHVEVQKRHFCVPLDWFRRPHTFREKNDEYLHWAERLSAKAIESCLERARLSTRDVDHLVFVSTSGLSTPSIDARLMNRLSFSTHMKRTPIFGLGCAGGAAGLARCFDLARGAPEERILLVTLELSSLTFQFRNYQKSNFVASALFADGAAAALICGADCPHEGVRIVDTYSTLWLDTLEVMGWDFSEDGLGVIFSRSIPQLLKKHIRGNIEQFLHRNALSLTDLIHYAVHPGGAKVIASLQQSLRLHPEKLRHSRFVLRNYGNMSSPTVLFILDRLLDQVTPGKGEYGLCAAFGPGFSSELVLLRW